MQGTVPTLLHAGGALGVVDALYFSVLTRAAIGDVDLPPATTFRKAFTMVFALLSVSAFVAVAPKTGAILREKEQQRARRRADKKRACVNSVGLVLRGLAASSVLGVVIWDIRHLGEERIVVPLTLLSFHGLNYAIPIRL